MQKVLFISPYFPPLSGSGVFRIHRLVKYLPDLGIQPIVVHLEHLAGQAEDEQELFKELPHEFAHYPAKYIEPSARGIRHWLKGGGVSQPTQASASGFPAIKGDRGWFSRLVAGTRDRVMIPDNFITWLPFVLPVLKKVIREHQPSAVVSTSSPETSSILGYYVKKKFGLPWISDYRDPWTDIVQKIRPAWPFSSFEKAIERKMLIEADWVTAYSKGLAKLLYSKIPEKYQNKFVSIGPAVDVEKFDAIPASPRKYDLLYTGNLDWRYPREFFPAMERINNKRREGGRAVFKVGIAGKVDPVIRDFMEPFTKSGWLDVTGYLPHDQAISLIKSAGCLLLLHPDHKWWVPGKVAEYLVSGKPILAVIGEGELKELLNGFGQVLISHDELEEVGQNIEKTMDLRDKPRSIPPELTARGQAQIMADIIRKMTAQ